MLKTSRSICRIYPRLVVMLQLLAFSTWLSQHIQASARGMLDCLWYNCSTLLLLYTVTVEFKFQNVALPTSNPNSNQTANKTQRPKTNIKTLSHKQVLLSRKECRQHTITHIDWCTNLFGKVLITTYYSTMNYYWLKLTWLVKFKAESRIVLSCQKWRYISNSLCLKYNIIYIYIIWISQIK